MFASSCRRRLLLRIPGEATNLLQLQSIHGARSSYSSTAVSRAPSSELCPATVSYLISCGLSPAAAATTATTQRIRIVSPDKADAVRALLRDYGFADADVVRTVRSAPSILVADPERILRPKLDFFASLRFEPRKIATAPFLLVCSLDKNIVPSIRFLRGVIGGDDQLRRGFSRVPRALMADVDRNMRPAVEALRRCGLDDAAISKLLVIQMGVLLTSPGRICEIFQELKAIGMSISDSRFLYCFRAMCGLKRGAWRQKLALLRSFGLSEGEVVKAFKTQPMLFLYADDNIKRKLRFLLDEVKLGVSDVIARPVILSYSMENCILPRCAVLSLLMKEGKIQREIKLLPALLGCSTVFSTRYVLRHADDVPDVVKAYEGKIKFQGFTHDT
jgi:mTERF domain-containing protein